MVDTVLLCPPTYYQIEYEINPWMDVKRRVNKPRAEEQYENLKEIYRKIGLKVEEIKPEAGFPDMVYAANHGFVIDDIFIKANFRYKQRRKEADFAEKYFRKKKFKVKKIPANISFEGQGDMFYRDGKFFCGYGKRTDREAIPFLEKIIGDEVISIAVNDPYYYHLDTCFAPLGNKKVVINPRSFSKEDVKKIKKNFKKVIETDIEDNRLMCCNLVAADGAGVIGKGISKNLKKEINSAGFEVKEAAMDEFLKGGGSVKCLTLEYFKSSEE